VLPGFSSWCCMALSWTRHWLSLHSELRSAPRIASLGNSDQIKVEGSEEVFHPDPGAMRSGSVVFP
jgi:hypothetical protein